MPYPTGFPRPAGSGRKPGTPNRVTAELRALIEHEASAPLPLLLVKLAKQAADDGDRAVAVQALAAACRFVYPQLKAIEHSGEITTDPSQLTLVIEEIAPKPLPACVPSALAQVVALTTDRRE